MTVRATPEAVEAVSDILLNAGAAGVVEAGPAVRAAYLPEGDEVEARVGQIERSVADLARFGLDPGPAEVTTRTIAEEAWAEAWKEYFHPTRIGDRLVVRPTWRSYTPADRDIVLDLDPGMAFGTGAHPTTTMCARALENHVRPGDTVLDVGTGSGILAIAAARLGATRVLACDTDPVAVHVARSNAAQNNVTDAVDVVEGSWPTLVERGQSGRIVVANIIASVIERLIPEAHHLVAPGGLLIASGIASFRAAGVKATLARHRWSVTKVHTEGEWVAMEARPENNGGGSR